MKPISLEVYSNQVDQDFSSASAPEVSNLLTSMKLIDFDVTFKKVSYSKDIEVSTGKIGVSASKTVEGSVQSSLSSSYSIMQQASSKKTAVVHLNITSYGNIFTAFLIADNCLAAGIPVFFSGLTKHDCTKSSIQADPILKKLPIQLERDPVLLNDFQKRVKRNTSFLSNVRTIFPFPLLPKELKIQATEFLKEKKNADQYFSEVEKINIILIGEYILRYQSIMSQFFDFFFKKGINRALLGYYFEFITQGIKISTLHKNLSPFLPKDAPKNLESKSDFLKAIHRNLRNVPLQSETIENFKLTLEGSIYLYRLQKDPILLNKIHILETKTQLEMEFLEERKLFLSQFHKTVSSFGEQNMHNEVPISIKELLFEELLHLFFEGSLQEKRSGYDLNSKEILSREILQVYKLICMYAIDASKIKPTKNIKGLAKVFAQKYSVRWGEIPLLIRNLKNHINPLEETLILIKNQFSKRESQYVEEKENKIAHFYLKSTFKFIPSLPYELKFAPNTTPLEKSIFLASSIQIGIDSVIQEEQKEKETTSHKTGLNYIRLHPNFYELNTEISPQLLQEGYQSFLENSVTIIFRELTLGKLDKLFETHKNYLFSYLYLKVVFQKSLYLEYHEFANLLITSKILTKDTLLKFGYDPETKNLFHLPCNHENERSTDFFSAETISNNLKQAFHKYNNYLKSLYKTIHKNGVSQIAWFAKNLFRLQKISVYNLWSEKAKEVFFEKESIEILWKNILDFLMPHIKPLTQSQNILIYLSYEFYFLSYFLKNKEVTLNDKIYTIQIKYNMSKNESTLDKLSKQFHTHLRSIKNSSTEGSHHLKKLAFLVQLIDQYQQIWIELQRNVSIYLIREIITQTSLRELYCSTTSKEEFELVEDDKKIFISQQVKQFSNLPYKKLFQKSRPDMDYDFQTLLEFHGNLVNIKQTQNKLTFFNTMLSELDTCLSKIPLIKQAPENIKLLRKSLRELTIFSSKTLVEYDMDGIKKLAMLTSELSKRILKGNEEETNMPMRYRFLTRSFNTLKYSNSTSIVSNFKNLLKQLASVEEINDQLPSGIFPELLYRSVIFLELIRNKKYFFIFPIYSQSDLLNSTLYHLIYYKGINNKIYVDIKEKNDFYHSTLQFLPPNKLMPLKDI